MLISVVSATSRHSSNTRIIADIYLSILKEKGHEAQLIDLADVPADFIGQGLYNSKSESPAWKSMQQMVSSSDKFVFIIPEYNGSFPGILKVWVDGLQFPTSFKGKKGGLIGISDGTQGGALAMGHFADILNYLGMNTLALRPRFIQIGKHLQEGKLTNAEYYKFLEMHADQLIAF